MGYRYKADRANSSAETWQHRFTAPPSRLNSGILQFTIGNGLKAVIATAALNQAGATEIGRNDLVERISQVGDGRQAGQQRRYADAVISATIAPK
jgi:hypothetical protein